MTLLERSTTIDASVEKVFSYIVDPASEIEMNPGITEITNISGKGVGQHWKWTYEMMGFILKGEAEVIEFVPNTIYVTKTTGDIISTWSYTLKAKGNRTRLNLVIDYTVPIPVLGKIAEMLLLQENERAADTEIANIKKRLES